MITTSMSATRIAHQYHFMTFFLLDVRQLEWYILKTYPLFTTAPSLHLVHGFVLDVVAPF
jgi:hypothetical protein